MTLDEPIKINNILVSGASHEIDFNGKINILVYLNVDKFDSEQLFEYINKLVIQEWLCGNFAADYDFINKMVLNCSTPFCIPSLLAEALLYYDQFIEEWHINDMHSHESRSLSNQDSYKFSIKLKVPDKSQGCINPKLSNCLNCKFTETQLDSEKQVICLYQKRLQHKKRYEEKC